MAAQAEMALLPSLQYFSARARLQLFPRRQVEDHRNVLVDLMSLS